MGSNYTPERIEQVRQQIRTSDDLTAEARELLLKFDKKIKANRGHGDRFSLARHYTLLSNTKLVGERADRLSDVIIDPVSGQ